MKTTPWWKQPSRAQWASFFAAWSGWVLDAFDFTIFLLVMKYIAVEFDVGIAAVGGSITLTLLVRLAGGLVSGWLADRYGRKLPLMLSLLWFAAFDAAIYFAPTFTWVVVLRTLFGFGMGAEWTAGTAMAMESFPPAGRKIASGLLQAGWPIGYMLAAAVAYFVVPSFGWRPMFLIASVPALLVVPIRFMVKDDAAHKPVTGPTASAADLLVPKVRRMLVLGSIVMALGFIVYYGLTSNYAVLLGGELHLDAHAVYANTILFNVGMLVGVVVTGIVASRRGVIVALVAPALLMIPALPLFVGAVPALLGVGAFLGGALGVGYSGVTPVLTTSLFPTHVRARAIGIVYHAGALLAASTPWAIGKLVETTGWTLATTIELVAGIGLFAMATAVLALRRELLTPESPRIDVPRATVVRSRATSSTQAGAPSTTQAGEIASQRDRVGQPDARAEAR
jgi:SHS family lactate transporter-like MFS transporter